MIRLYTDISAAFKDVRKAWKPKRLDVLVGYFGVGATKVLKELGFRKIRFVFGLSESKPSLVKSKITELNQLKNTAEIRTSDALHTKLYIMDNSVVIVGSANLTSAGFGSNQEAVIVTDYGRLVRDARKLFAAIWEDALPLDVKSIRPALRSKSPSEETGSIGRGSRNSQSLFAQAQKRSTASRTSMSKRDREVESVGWVLNHQNTGPRAYDSTEEFVEDLVWARKPGELWHWVGVLGEEGKKPYKLILARNMEVYGHAIATITHDVTPSVRRKGYNCAFRFQQLYLLEEHGKERIPLRSIVPKSKMRSFRGLIKLSTHPWILEKYEKYTGKKLLP